MFISIYISLALLGLDVEARNIFVSVGVLLASSDLCLLSIDVRSVLCITDIFDRDLLLGDLDFMK